MTHILYILIRSDMASMNGGKAAAQASHASNAFVKHASGSKGVSIKRAFKEWTTETTQGFGTVLTLAVNEQQMRTAVEVMQNLDYVTEVIHDPTYPVRDGEVCHFLPIDTCAYVFVPNKEDDIMAKAVLGNFSLYP